LLNVIVKKDISVYNSDLEYWFRRAIPPDLKTQMRERLLKRQYYKYSLCGKIFLPFDIIETDHITPIAKGGPHKNTNL
jgi:5-methylcytosine-specific restriction endonuclease McrA